MHAPRETIYEIPGRSPPHPAKCDSLPAPRTSCNTRVASPVEQEPTLHIRFLRPEHHPNRPLTQHPLFVLGRWWRSETIGAATRAATFAARVPDTARKHPIQRFPFRRRQRTPGPDRLSRPRRTQGFPPDRIRQALPPNRAPTAEPTSLLDPPMPAVHRFRITRTHSPLVPRRRNTTRKQRTRQHPPRHLNRPHRTLTRTIRVSHPAPERSAASSAVGTSGPTAPAPTAPRPRCARRSSSPAPQPAATHRFPEIPIPAHSLLNRDHHVRITRERTTQQEPGTMIRRRYRPLPRQQPHHRRPRPQRRHTTTPRHHRPPADDPSPEPADFAGVDGFAAAPEPDPICGARTPSAVYAHVKCRNSPWPPKRGCTRSPTNSTGRTPIDASSGTGSGNTGRSSARISTVTDASARRAGAGSLTTTRHTGNRDPSSTRWRASRPRCRSSCDCRSAAISTSPTTRAPAGNTSSCDTGNRKPRGKAKIHPSLTRLPIPSPEPAPSPIPSEMSSMYRAYVPPQGVRYKHTPVPYLTGNITRQLLRTSPPAAIHCTIGLDHDSGRILNAH